MTTVTYPSGVVAPMPPVPPKRWTVAEYHEMLKNGTLSSGDPVELLEGWIVPKMSRNTPHDVALVLVPDGIRSAQLSGWHVRVQSAITTSDSEPEPDVVIARGVARGYIGNHPMPADIGLLVEIADSSLAHDRGIKAQIYARAAVVVYWIVNLVDGQVEVYSDPDPFAAEPYYRTHTDFLPGDSVPLVLDGREVAGLPVNDLLP